MTYGYGDEPNGRRPPTRPQPATHPRRSPDQAGQTWQQSPDVPPDGRYGRPEGYLDASDFIPYGAPPGMANQYQADPGRYQADQQPYRTDQHRSGAHPAVTYQPDQYQPDQYWSDQYRPDQYPTGPYPAAPPGYHPAGQQDQRRYLEREPYRAPQPQLTGGYPQQTSGYPQQRSQYRDGYDNYQTRGGVPAVVPRPRVDQPQPLTRLSTPARRRRGRAVFAWVVVLLVLAGGGVAAAAVVAGRKPAAHPIVAPTAAVQIANRKVDPAPLTEAEVFGVTKITSTAPGAASYHVVKSQAATNCGTAVTGEIGTLLTSLGCSQVVRATILSPDNAYVITAGVFNLPDAKSATKAHDSIKAAVDARKGRFSGFAAGGSTDVIAQAATHLAWDTRGHYLMYCVIALANGKTITATDARTPLIVTDIVEKYLSDTVIGARETRLASPSASQS